MEVRVKRGGSGSVVNAGGREVKAGVSSGLEKVP